MASLSGQRILVTGAGGFVGGRLVPRLEAAGAQVTATDRELDVTDEATLVDALARLRPQALIHLAAISSVAASLGDARGVFRVNYLGARAVLRAVAASAPGARVLLVGSGVMYGSAPPGSPPFAEDAPLRPGSPYAWGKAAADLLGAAYADHGLEVVRVRPFNHTGPGQADAFVAASFARQLAEMEAGLREPVLRVGNLDSVRDFLDVDDVIDAYVALLDRAVTAGAYNVASGRGTSARELLASLLARSTLRPEVEVDPARVRPTDLCVGDARRLREVTGWEPRRRLDDTLGRVLGYWRERVSHAA